MQGCSRALAVALAAVTWLGAAPAGAQPRGGASRPPAEVANDLVKQAITKSQAGDHLAAIDLYLNAYSLIPQHTLLSNVGAAYLQAGKPVEALKYFCLYLEKDPTGTNATYAKAKAKAIQIELGNDDVEDDAVCAPPARRRDGDGDGDGDGSGDGELSGTKALRGDGGDSGGGDGGDGGGGAKRPGRGLKLAGLGVAALGVAGLGLGGYYGYVAADRSDYLSSYVQNHPGEPWPDNLKDIEHQGEQAEQRQIVAMIAGGALLATGVVLYVVGATRGGGEERPAKAAAKLRVVPTAARGGFGFALARGF